MEDQREITEWMKKERYKAFAKLADKHGVCEAYYYATMFGILGVDARAWFERWQDERHD